MKRERILLALQGTSADAAPISAAKSIAPIFNADIRAVFVEPDPAAYMLWTGPGAAGASVVSGALDTVREEADKAAETAKAAFDEALAGSDLEAGASFKRICDSPSDAAQQARLIRLLVTCPLAAAGKGPLADFSAACLVDEGCPVFVPRSGGVPPRTIAVAWDGSKEAARAALAAEPFFAPGVDVTILSSARNLDFHDRAASAPNRLTHWLRARGIEPVIKACAESGSVGEALLAAASEADLLVAGAYGHSRIAQFMFGGVTRTLLTASGGPSLLIAH